VVEPPKVVHPSAACRATDAEGPFHSTGHDIVVPQAPVGRAPGMARVNSTHHHQIL